MKSPEITAAVRAVKDAINATSEELNRLRRALAELTATPTQRRTRGKR